MSSRAGRQSVKDYKWGTIHLSGMSPLAYVRGKARKTHGDALADLVRVSDLAFNAWQASHTLQSSLRAIYEILVWLQHDLGSPLPTRLVRSSPGRKSSASRSSSARTGRMRKG